MARNAHGEGQAPHKWRGKWRGSIFVGYGEEGKQKRKYCYAKTREDCLTKWNALKRQQQDSALPAGPSFSVKQWFDHWLLVKDKEICPRTLEDYGYTLRHILPHLGRTKLDKITPLQVQCMQLAIADAVSARAAVQARGLVHNALDDALKLGLVARNVVAAVAPVKYEKPEFQIWTAAEVVRFLEFAKASPYYPVFYTALTLGLRPGELIALHWDDVDGNKVHVRHNVSIVKNKPVLGTPKTKRGNRILTLPDDTLEVLMQQGEALAQDKCDSPLVFPSRTRGFLQHGNLLRTLRLYSERAEVTRVRMHDLRHTYASMRIAHGADIVRLSRDLGHANASFTLDVYAHLFTKHQQHEAPSLNELVGLS